MDHLRTIFRTDYRHTDKQFRRESAEQTNVRYQVHYLPAPLRSMVDKYDDHPIDRALKVALYLR